MTKYIFIFFSAFIFFRCNTHEEYVLYRGDRHINYPAEKLRIVFINDTTGIFINRNNKKEVFSQQFYYTKAANFMKIKNINIKNDDLISLKKGDTIIYYKNKLFYFYDGKKRYALYFRKSFF